MDGFAGSLAALMRERGVSASALAREVPCDRALICRYRNGKQRPSERLASRIDDILGAAGALSALAERPPTRRAVLAGSLLAGGLLGIGAEALDRITWAQERPAHADLAAAESLAGVLAVR